MVGGKEQIEREKRDTRMRVWFFGWFIIKDREGEGQEPGGTGDKTEFIKLRADKNRVEHLRVISGTIEREREKEREPNRRERNHTMAH